MHQIRTFCIALDCVSFGGQFDILEKDYCPCKNVYMVGIVLTVLQRHVCSIDSPP